MPFSNHSRRALARAAFRLAFPVSLDPKGFGRGLAFFFVLARNGRPCAGLDAPEAEVLVEAGVLFLSEGALDGVEHVQV